MREDVAVEDGLSSPLLEAHADDGGGILGDPNGVLDEAVRRLDPGHGDDLEVVDVDVEGMAFGASARGVGDFDGPLLARIEEDRGGNGELVVELIVDAEVDADDGVLFAGEES